MTESTTPDYARYSVRELQEALSTVDGVRFPDRKRSIETELEQRGAIDTDRSETGTPQTTKGGNFWSYVDWVRIATWYLIAAGIWVLFAFAYSAYSRQETMFDIWDLTLLSLGMLSLAAGLLLRRNTRLGYWLSIVVLASQTIAISTQLLVWRIHLLGGMMFSAIDTGEVWEYKFGADFGYVGFLIGSGGTPKFVINLLLVVFLVALIRRMIARRTEQLTSH